jgi:hypothetical protein
VSVYSDDSPVRCSEIETWTSLWFSTGGRDPNGCMRSLAIFSKSQTYL